MFSIFFISQSYAPKTGEYKCSECGKIIKINKNQIIPYCSKCGYFEFEFKK